MGLGSLANVGLAEARQKAAEARKLTVAANAKQNTTFDAAAGAYIAAHQSAWRNAKHAAQWSTTLEAYASPVFGKVAVRDIDTALVLKVLEPMWNKKTQTAYRVRGRIENILDWAKVRGYREGENPARWRGHLDHLLPARSDVQTVAHHAALPYGELPAFLKHLGEQPGVGARAIEFTILTAARTGETIEATLGEINRRDRVWIVPKSRMKAKKEHRVPLSDRAMAIIDDLAPLRGESEYLFPGVRGGLSAGLMLSQLWRMGRADLTVHGFRSTFRDWAAETTNFPSEVVEMALAHAIGNRVDAAYRRGDLFDKRRRLMNQWANYCLHGKVSADVVPLRVS
jgi:integrase